MFAAVIHLRCLCQLLFPLLSHTSDSFFPLLQRSFLLLFFRAKTKRGPHLPASSSSQRRDLPCRPPLLPILTNDRICIFPLLDAIISKLVLLVQQEVRPRRALLAPSATSVPSSHRPVLADYPRTTRPRQRWSTLFQPFEARLRTSSVSCASMPTPFLAEVEPLVPRACLLSANLPVPKSGHKIENHKGKKEGINSR
jgi:hypothetical protein